MFLHTPILIDVRAFVAVFLAAHNAPVLQELTAFLCVCACVCVQAPGYSKAISNPMCFDTMRDKLNTGQYPTWEAFEFDLNLVFDNAILFNGQGEPHTQTHTPRHTDSVLCKPQRKLASTYQFWRSMRVPMACVCVCVCDLPAQRTSCRTGRGSSAL